MRYAILMLLLIVFVSIDIRFISDTTASCAIISVFGNKFAACHIN